MSSPQGFYVYCVVPSDLTELPVDTAMGLGSLRIVRAGSVAVVGEWVDLDVELARKKYLTAHTDLINRLAEQGPVLPLQFGSVLADEAAAEAFLSSDGDQYAEALRGIEGRCQMILRGRYDLDEVIPQLAQADPRIADLHAQTKDLPAEAGQRERVRLGELVSQALQERRAHDQRWVEEAIAGVVETVVAREAGGYDGMVDLALAVRVTELDHVEATAEALAAEVHPWARLSLVGPMAMYDFVGRR